VVRLTTRAADLRAFRTSSPVCVLRHVHRDRGRVEEWSQPPNRRLVDQPRLTALILWTFTNRGGAQERWIEAGSSGRSGRPSPVTGDAAMPDRGYVPDVPVPMARGVVVTTEELAAAMGTRTALSGLSSGWVA
jgi:hypothetical protein